MSKLDMSELKSAIRNQIAETVRAMIDVHADTLATQLVEADEQRMSFGVTVKLQISGQKLGNITKIAFAKKWTDETEGLIDLDKDQTKMEFAKRGGRDE